MTVTETSAALCYSIDSGMAVAIRTSVTVVIKETLF